MVEYINWDKVTKDSLVIIRSDDTDKLHSISRELCKSDKFAEKMNETGATLILFGPEDSIEILGEEEMAELGWVRKK